MVKRADTNAATNADTKKRKPIRCPAIRKIRKKKLATAIAKRLPISRAAVSMWRRVPAKHVSKVGKFLHIAAHRIRPDLYSA